MGDSYSCSEQEPLGEIETMIRAAGEFVQPTEDLRPRTLEAARRYCDDRRAEQKLGGFVIAALLLVAFSTPTIQYAHLLRDQATSPSASEIQDRAIEFSSQPEIGQHWGLAEAFTQMRRGQANRLGQSLRTIK